jgi:hypothetical protein
MCECVCVVTSGIFGVSTVAQGTRVEQRLSVAAHTYTHMHTHTHTHTHAPPAYLV